MTWGDKVNTGMGLSTLSLSQGQGIWLLDSTFSLGQIGPQDLQNALPQVSQEERPVSARAFWSENVKNSMNPDRKNLGCSATGPCYTVNF